MASAVATQRQGYSQGLQRILFQVGLSAVLLCGCVSSEKSLAQSGEHPIRPPATFSPSDTEKEIALHRNKDVIQRCFEEWANHDDTKAISSVIAFPRSAIA